MRACAKTTILAADSSKLDSVYFIKVMDLEPGDILVTNQLPNKEWRDYLERKQVRFIEG